VETLQNEYFLKEEMSGSDPPPIKGIIDDPFPHKITNTPVLFDDPLHPYYQGSRLADVWARLSTSSTCLFIYIVIGCLNLFLLIWQFSGGESMDPAVGIVIESLINVVLALEVVFSILAFGKEFFRKWLRILDFVITLLCITFFILYILEDEIRQNGEWRYPSTVLLVFRYSFQFIRLALIIYESNKKRHFFKQEDIEFPVEIDGNIHDENPIPYSTATTKIESISEVRSRPSEESLSNVVADSAN